MEVLLAQDVAHAALRFVLDELAAPLPVAGATVTLDVGPVTVAVRIVGGSHQTTAFAAGAGVQETVARLADGGAPLPEWLDRRSGPLRYVFRSSVEQIAADTVAARARAFHDAAQRDPGGLSVVSPGLVTAVISRPQPGGAAWESVHLDAGAGILVRTFSRVLGTRTS